MHAGNDLIMPGGASKANEIIIGAEDVKPTFEANGQIGLKDELMYMFSYKSAAWGDFEVSADGTQTAEAKLGDDYTASVGEDGKILVNGQKFTESIRQMSGLEQETIKHRLRQMWHL